MRTIDFNNFGKSTQERKKEETAIYREYLLSTGMNELTKDEFLEILESLNYKIDKGMCTTYYNDYNKYPYLAYGLSYIDKKSKQSFAHYEQRLRNHENLDKLQKIRSGNFVFENGRIWDL